MSISHRWRSVLQFIDNHDNQTEATVVAILSTTPLENHQVKAAMAQIDFHSPALICRTRDTDAGLTRLTLTDDGKAALQS